MANEKLQNAKVAKNDEFYTQYVDIEKEMNAYLDFDNDVFRNKTVLLPCDDPEWSNFTKYFAQNFQRFGLKKLISTSFAVESKNYKIYQPSIFELESPLFDKDKTRIKGKIFILDSDINGDSKINVEDLQWHYLEGDGDFRSDEVKKLRDEADIIITNPPFSLFREFVAWIFEAKKKFAVIGNMNAITYKEIFPLIKENQMWLGATISSGDREFGVPREYPLQAAGWRIDELGNHFIRVKGVRWYSNLEHGRRHQPLELMSMADNIKYSKHKEIKGIGYRKYDNYDAIEVPFTDAIPSDYFSSEKYEKNEKNIEKYLTSEAANYNPINRTEQNRTEQNRTEQNRTEQNSSIAASWEFRSASLTSIARNSSISLDSTGMSQIIQTTDTDSQLMEKKLMRESLSNIKCNGVMGVPISFLDKYCPEQFEILGATESEGKGFSNGLWNENSGIAQATVCGERVYKRIFIRHK